MSNNIFIQRQQSLQNALKTHKFDAAILNPGPDLHYLTGLKFHLMERPILTIFPVDSHPVIILPALERMKTAGLDFEMETVTYGENRADWLDAFSSAFSNVERPLEKLGVIPRRLRLLEFEYLKNAAPKATLTSAQGVFASLRMIKDPEELALMREAVRIAECALQATLSAIKPDVTEKQIAAKLVYHLLHQGSDPDLPFSPIVSFGANTANPHASPTDRPLHLGELVLIDWGAKVNGYCSDITRTFAMGDIDPEFEKIAEFVIKANAAARKAADNGIPTRIVDQAARESIREAGYGEYFIHRTGHGLGIEPHEEPYISEDDTTILEPGMTFTIEPGIYIPNRGGIRIEDDVVVTKAGLESLSRFPRELTQLHFEE